jgi:hypothetical protein
MEVQAKKLSAREEIKELNKKIAELNGQIVSQTFTDKLTVKVGDKGSLLIYGLQKWPISLYASQAIRMEKLLTSPEFKKFVVDNESKLAKKEEAKKAE